MSLHVHTSTALRLCIVCTDSASVRCKDSVGSLQQEHPGNSSGSLCAALGKTDLQRSLCHSMQRSRSSDRNTEFDYLKPINSAVSNSCSML
jgi:hypothetical protein